MSRWWAIVLILIGVASVLLSLANWEHPPGERRLLELDRSLSGESIARQLRFHRPRVDSQLGVQYGIAFIFLGLFLQTILYLYWF
ncbi:MAG: hypothetical protein AAFU85_00260 [Planctomycetota bacterium]